MLYELSHHFLLPLLFATGLVAGVVDAIAGGGGLITVPMLLSVGVPPHIALGTNKLQSSIGTFAASFSYYRHGLVSLKNLRVGLLFVLIGAMSGAIVSQLMSAHILKKIIPFLLILILAYSVFSPKLGAKDKTAKLNSYWFYAIFGLLLGFYDGFFGPGTGSFWVFAITFFLGFNLTKATAHTKVFNLTSNLVALACFMIGQNVDYRIACFMAAGQLIGGRLGAYLAIKHGAEFIRPIFIVMVLGTILTLSYKTYADESSYLGHVAHQFGIFTLMMVVSLLTASILGFYFWNSKRQEV